MKNIVIKILLVFKVHIIVRFFFQKNRITVIYYHDINKENFDWQVEYLKSHYNIIDLKTFQSYLSGNKSELPNYSLLITFDDGHIGNYRLLETIKANKIKPVIFLTAKIIGTNKTFWFNIPFKNSTIKDNLKRIPDIERRGILETNYKEFLIKTSPEALTFEQIKEMSGYVDFQSHTMDHPCLPNADYEVADYEISNSKIIIENIVGEQVYAIAYPNGDFSAREIELSIKSGYSLGFATSRGFINKNSDPFSLPRLSTNDTNNYGEFILRTTGIWFILKKMKFSRHE